LVQVFAHAVMHRSATPPSRGGTYGRKPGFGNCPIFLGRHHQQPRSITLAGDESRSSWPFPGASLSPEVRSDRRSENTRPRKFEHLSFIRKPNGARMSWWSHRCFEVGSVAPTDAWREISLSPPSGPASQARYRDMAHGRLWVLGTAFRFPRCHLAENRPTVAQAGQSRHFQSQVGD